MNQPSDEAMKKLYLFLLKTSIPRILEEEKKGETNELNNNSRKQSTIG